MKQFWLVKSEPDVYPLEQLKKDRTAGWTGVRNYQARNTMRDAMKKGDGVLFYHSNAKPNAIVGLAKVSKESHPDPTQFDPGSEYYDPKSQPDAPTWMMVEITFEREFRKAVTLDELKKVAGLKDMALLNNSRLSVQPVSAQEYALILKLAASR